LPIVAPRPASRHWRLQLARLEIAGSGRRQVAVGDGIDLAPRFL
jgi:hypothetical protein